MRRIWIYCFHAVFIIALIACTRSKKQSSVSGSTKNDGPAVSVNTGTTITVLATRSYCGGARPLEGMLQELRTPRPLAETWVYIRRGSTNDLQKLIVDSAMTDANGQVKLLLPGGEYSLVFTDKKDSTRYNFYWSSYAQKTENYSAIDKRCLDDWLKNPEKVFEVKGDGHDQFEVQIHIPCSWNRVPCSIYSGPLPP